MVVPYPSEMVLAVEKKIVGFLYTGHPQQWCYITSGHVTTQLQHTGITTTKCWW